jgi:type IV secretion system protein VirB4
MYLDALLGSEDLIGGLTPRVGDQRIAVISIDGLPQESWPLCCRFWMGFGCNTVSHPDLSAWISWTAKRKSPPTERGATTSFPLHRQILQPAQRPPNRDAQVMVEDAEEALMEVQGGYVGAGFLSSCIVLLHEDQIILQDWARELRRAILTLGFGCRIETINALDAWLGTHPGNWFANLRRPLINTLNLADLLPLSSIWAGEEHCPCPFYPANSPALAVCTTDGSTPFWFNLHVRDVGHTLIFGPTGAGKSTLLGLIAAQFRRYKGAQVFAFDKGMSMFALCEAVGAHTMMSAAVMPCRLPPSNTLTIPLSRHGPKSGWVRSWNYRAHPLPREIVMSSTRP